VNYKSLLALGIFCLFCFLAVPHTIYAEEPFIFSYFTSYTVNEDVETVVNHQTTLTNQTPNVYATSYSYIIGSTRISKIRAWDASGELDSQVNKEENQIKVDIKFNKINVGLDRSYVFNLSYSSNDFAQLNGKVLDIGIPQLKTNGQISSLSMALLVADKFGKASFISPSPMSVQSQNGYYKYLFPENTLLNQSVVAFFGTEQLFNFDINYHLKNDKPYPIETEVALIPDTTYQKVAYRLIDPLPAKINRDSDGNWLAGYRLLPNTKLKIQTKGQVRSSFLPDTSPYLNQALPEYVTSQPFWPVGDPAIIQAGTETTDIKSVYDFVVDSLSYNYERLDQPTERKGASWILQHPDQAVCMEFTDLFVTLARSKNIPSRELNGYACTNNPALKPVSLDKDLLHAWPQYYDQQKNLWIDVDPTWEKTTGGIDYFNNHDLNRIIFAIHGSNSDYPVAAGAYKDEENPDKDLTITFADSFNSIRQWTLVQKTPTRFLSGFTQPFQLSFINTGSIAIYQLPLSVQIRNAELVSEANPTIDFVAPLMNQPLIIQLKSDHWYTETKADLIIKADNKELPFTLTFQPFFIIYAKPITVGALSLLAIILISSALALKSSKDGNRYISEDNKEI
jgi:transglutaminase-like putative cysteine protease